MRRRPRPALPLLPLALAFAGLAAAAASTPLQPAPAAAAGTGRHLLLWQYVGLIDEFQDLQKSVRKLDEAAPGLVANLTAAARREEPDAALKGLAAAVDALLAGPAKARKRAKQVLDKAVALVDRVV